MRCHVLIRSREDSDEEGEGLGDCLYMGGASISRLSVPQKKKMW